VSVGRVDGMRYFIVLWVDCAVAQCLALNTGFAVAGFGMNVRLSSYNTEDVLWSELLQDVFS
jgi:hypothetical protein